MAMVTPVIWAGIIVVGIIAAHLALSSGQNFPGFDAIKFLDQKPLDVVGDNRSGTFQKTAVVIGGESLQPLMMMPCTPIITPPTYPTIVLRSFPAEHQRLNVRMVRGRLH